MKEKKIQIENELIRYLFLLLWRLVSTYQRITCVRIKRMNKLHRYYFQQPNILYRTYKRNLHTQMSLIVSRKLCAKAKIESTFHLIEK